MQANENLIALVVDDGAENRFSFSQALKKLGFVVIEAENGQVGLKMLQEKPIAVIFLDYEMPIMNGFEFLLAQAGTSKKHVPVIMISSNQSCNIEAVEHYGACLWINKPFEFHELESALVMAGVL